MATSVNFNIGADTTEAKKAVSALGTDVQKVLGGQNTINITADTSKASSQVNDLLKQVNAIESKKIGLELDSKATENQIVSIKKKLNDLQQNKTKLEIDTSIAEKKISNFKDKINEIMESEAKLEINADDAEAQIKKIQSEIDAIQDKKAKIEISVGNAESDIKAVSSLLNDLEDKKLNIDAEVSANVDELKQLQGQIDDLQDKKVEVNVNANSESVNQAVEEVNSLNDKDVNVNLNVNTEGFADIKAKFDVIGNAGGVLSEVSEQGKELNDTMREVQAQTGLTSEEMENLRNSAEDAFKQGVGENVAEAVKIMGQGHQVLKDFLNPEDINKFIVSASGIAKVFGGETTEIINKSRTFIKNFGLDGQEAANLISLAMQKSNGDMGDVLDTLDEYSQLMKTAGYSAEEFTGVLVTGGEAGTRNFDKLADAIKETQIRLNAGDITTALKDINSPITDTIQNIVNLGQAGKISVKETLQQSAQAIESAFDSGKISASVRDKLSVALSGTMAEDIGGQMYTQIFSAPIDADAVRLKAQQAGDLMAKAIAPKNIFENMQKELETVWADISAGIAPIASQVGGVLQSIASVAPALNLVNELDFGKLKDSLTSIGDDIKNVASAIVGQFVPASVAQTTATEGATVAQEGLNASFLTNPLTIWVVAIGAVVGALILLYKNVESVRVFIDGLINTVKDVFGGIMEALSPAIDTIKAFGTLIFDVVAVPFRLVYDVVSGVIANLQGVGGQTKTIGETIAGLKPIFSAIFGTITTIYSAISTTINTIVNLIVGILIPAFTPLVKTAIDLGSAIGGFVYDSFMKLFSAIQPIIDGIGALESTVGDLWDKVFGDSKDKSKTAAKDIRENFENSLNSNVSLKLKASLELDKTAGALDEAKSKVASLQVQLNNAVASGKPPKDIEQIKNQLGLANDEVASLSNDLAKKMPSAIQSSVNSTEVLADGTTKIKTNYTINTEAVKKFANEQKNAYSPQIQKMQGDFNNGIIQQANEYNNAKKRLEELQSKASKGGLSDTDQAEIEKQKQKINSLGKTIVDNLKKGEGKGYDMQKSVTSVAGAFGTTTDSVEKLINQQDKAKQKTEEMVLSAKTLSTVYSSITNNLATMNTESVGAINLINQAMKAKQAGKTANDFIKAMNITDEAQKKMLNNNWNNLSQQLTIAKQAAKNSAKTQLQLNKDSDKINKQYTEAGLKEAEDRNKELTKLQKTSNLEILKNQELAKADLIVNEEEKAIQILDINKKYALQQNKIDAQDARERAIKATQIEKQYIIDRQKAVIDGRKKEYERLQKLDDDNNKMYEDSLNTNLEILKTFVQNGTATEKQLLDYRSKSLEQFDLKQRSTLLGLIQNSTEYQKKQQDIINQISTGTIDVPQAIAKLKEYQDLTIKELVKTNENAKVIVTKGTYDRSELEKSINLETADVINIQKINSIKDNNEQEYQLQLYYANKTYRDDLKNAGAFLDKKQEAYEKYNNAIDKASTDFMLSQQSIYTRVASGILTTFSSNFNNIKAITNVSTIKQAKIDLKTIKDEEADLLKQRNEGAITYEDYVNKYAELEDKRAEANKKSTLSQIEWIKTLNNALEESLTKMIEQVTNNNLLLYDKFKTNLTEQANALTNFGAKSKEYGDATQKATDLTTESWANAGVAVGATFTNMEMSGKSFVKSTVMAFLAGIKALIPMFIFKIYAEEIASKSFAGLVTAPVLVGVLMALTSALESGLSEMNFANGGLYPAGNFPTGLVKNHIQVANVGEKGEPEFVMRSKVTKFGLNELEEINKKGITPSQWAYQKFGIGFDKIEKRLQSIENVLSSTKLVESTHNYQIKMTNNEIKSINKLDFARV